MCINVFKHDVEVNKVLQLGRKTGGKITPLLVGLSDEDEKYSLLFHFSTLHQHELYS